MTKLFCYLDVGEYSEGDAFYITADSLKDAAKVFKCYMSSHDYWGDKIPPEHKIDNTIKRKLSNFMIKECPGVYIDDYRKNRILWSIASDDNDYVLKYSFDNNDIK